MAKIKNIILIGFMGTGKTSVGQILAKKLNFIFVDIDELIEKILGMKISEIFTRFGEPRFRDFETEIIKLITKKKRQVIATGGGAVLREENMAQLKASGVVFCLTAPENVIFKRVRQCKNRPLLQVDNPEQRIRALIKKRMPFYEKADFSINTDGLTPEEVADKIIKEYERLIDGKAQSRAT